MTSTDSFAMSNRLPIIAANTPLSPPTSQRTSAASAAVRKKPSQSRLSMRRRIAAMRKDRSSAHARARGRARARAHLAR